MNRPLIEPTRTNDVVADDRSGAGTTRRLLPWAVALAFALAGAWLAQRTMVARSEMGVARAEQALADLAQRAARQHLEAERILSRRETQVLAEQLALANRELAATQQQLAERTREQADQRQQFQALAASAAHISQQLAEARERGDQLVASQRGGDLANLHVALLTAASGASFGGRAMVIWNAVRQEGLLSVADAPRLDPQEKLHLWVLGASADTKPVHAGALMPDGRGSARLRFKPARTVERASAFAVSRERDGEAGAGGAPTDIVLRGSIQ